MNVHKAASRIRLPQILSSANHPDNWLTIARRPTVCLSEYYDEKPDSLTVFEQFMLLQRIKRYLQLLLISINID